MKLFNRGKVEMAAVEASVNVDDIRRKFYDQVAVGDQYWWWICAMYVDPQEIIIDTDAGDIYRMSYSINGDAIDFGEPQLVKIQYVDAVAMPKKVQATVAVAGMNAVRGDKVLATFSSREESRPVNASNQEGEDVNYARLRKRLGLSADVSDEDVLLAAEENLGTDEEGDPNAADPAATEAVEGDDEEDDPDSDDTTTAGTATVDASVLAQLQADAAAGRAARDEQLRDKDDAVLLGAIRDGKFPPARKAHYAKLLKVDREGTIEQINGLEKDMVPLESRGVTRTGELEDETTSVVAGYPQHWLPEMADRKAAIAAGARPRVVIE